MIVTCAGGRTRLGLLCATLVLAAGDAGACDFHVVKQQIDIVLDKDAKLAAEFRREVKDGSDSIATLEKLVSPETAKQIDICRFDVAEYLTKRGFAPAH